MWPKNTQSSNHPTSSVGTCLLRTQEFISKSWKLLVAYKTTTLRYIFEIPATTQTNNKSFSKCHPSLAMYVLPKRQNIQNRSQDMMLSSDMSSHFNHTLPPGQSVEFTRCYKMSKFDPSLISCRTYYMMNGGTNILMNRTHIQLLYFLWFHCGKIEIAKVYLKAVAQVLSSLSSPNESN